MLKRCFDIVASFLGLIFFSPILLCVALLIQLYMSGPVLFTQRRIGRYGKPFTIYKFRTMTINHGGNTVSVKGESRITPLGAKLRKFKLDEFPELWNVLIGDMSFVGPRPEMETYIARLEGEERKILELRPGITCPASIKYANEEELLASVQDPQKYTDEVIWPDKIKMNLNYYENRSFIKDILIILQTVTGKKKMESIVQ